MNTNQPLTCLIVDDEPSARDTLLSILENYFPEVEVVACVGDGASGLTEAARLAPDLIFLDIEMPGISGLEVARLLPKAQFHVVFTTAYREHALRAIKLSALDYLLKPLGVEELQTVIARAREKRSAIRLHERLHLIEQRLSDGRTERIALPSMEGFEVVELETVVRCEADSNYTRFFRTDGAPIFVARTLSEYDGLLRESGFVRIHQSHLVNLIHVRRYMKGRGGNVEMGDGSVLPVSRERKKVLLEALKGVR